MQVEVGSEQVGTGPALPGAVGESPVDEVAGGFPATLLWRFRLASLGTQAVLWTTLGLLFGALTERSLQDRRRQPAAGAR